MSDEAAGAAWGGHVGPAMLRRLVSRAVAAPSSHNTQPWRFDAEGDAITVLADRTRALPVNDPDDRELTISCGAALLNLRVAARAAGLDADVSLLPGGPASDRLATVRLAPGASATAAERRLDDAIPVRRTYRGILHERDISSALRDALVDAVDSEGARLVVIAGDPDRRELIDLIVEGDLRQFDNRAWRRELADWMHPRRSHDGLAYGAVARLAVARLDLGESSGTRDAAVAAEAPLLAVLTTAGDGPWDWLVAGQALERTLLVAADAGLFASFLNQPCQVPELRPSLAALAGQANPQLVLRFGYPPPASMPGMRRRPVGDVLAGSSALGPAVS